MSSDEQKINLQRLEYLKSEYKPDPILCVEADFKCDFHVDDSNQCPCEWAATDKQKENCKKYYPLLKEIDIEHSIHFKD